MVKVLAFLGLTSALLVSQAAFAEQVVAKVSCSGEWEGVTTGRLVLEANPETPGLYSGYGAIGSLPITKARVSASIQVTRPTGGQLLVDFAYLSATKQTPRFMNATGSVRGVSIALSQGLEVGVGSSQPGLFPDNEDMSCRVDFDFVE